MNVETNNKTWKLNEDNLMENPCGECCALCGKRQDCSANCIGVSLIKHRHDVRCSDCAYDDILNYLKASKI